ncbi:hypothetical protein D3C75_1198520 [compost metagenome]
MTDTVLGKAPPAPRPIVDVPVVRMAPFDTAMVVAAVWPISSEEDTEPRRALGPDNVRPPPSTRIAPVMGLFPVSVNEPARCFSSVPAPVSEPL